MEPSIPSTSPPQQRQQQQQQHQAQSTSTTTRHLYRISPALKIELIPFSSSSSSLSTSSSSILENAAATTQTSWLRQQEDQQNLINATATSSSGCGGHQLNKEEVQVGKKTPPGCLDVDDNGIIQSITIGNFSGRIVLHHHHRGDDEPITTTMETTTVPPIDDNNDDDEDDDLLQFFDSSSTLLESFFPVNTSNHKRQNMSSNNNINNNNNDDDPLTTAAATGTGNPPLSSSYNRSGSGGELSFLPQLLEDEPHNEFSISPTTTPGTNNNTAFMDGLVATTTTSPPLPPPPWTAGMMPLSQQQQQHHGTTSGNSPVPQWGSGSSCGSVSSHQYYHPPPPDPSMLTQHPQQQQLQSPPHAPAILMETAHSIKLRSGFQSLSSFPSGSSFRDHQDDEPQRSSSNNYHHHHNNKISNSNNNNAYYFEPLLSSSNHHPYQHNHHHNSMNGGNSSTTGSLHNGHGSNNGGNNSTTSAAATTTGGGNPLLHHHHHHTAAQLSGIVKTALHVNCMKRTIPEHLRARRCAMRSYGPLTMNNNGNVNVNSTTTTTTNTLQLHEDGHYHKDTKGDGPSSPQPPPFRYRGFGTIKNALTPPTPLHAQCAQPQATLREFWECYNHNPLAIRIKDGHGRYPLHILADNETLLTTPEGKQTATVFGTHLIQEFPLAIVTPDVHGWLPFFRIISDWLIWVNDPKRLKDDYSARADLDESKRLCYPGASTRRTFPRVELWEEADWCFAMLSTELDVLGRNHALPTFQQKRRTMYQDAATTTTTTTTDGSYSKRDERTILVGTLTELLPHLVPTVLLIEDDGVDTRSRTLELTIFRRLLLCPATVGMWLIDMLNYGGVPARRAVDYLWMVSHTTIDDITGGFGSARPNDWKHFDEARQGVFDEVSDLKGAIASLVTLTTKEMERAASTQVIWHAMGNKLSRPFVLGLVLIDLVLHITLMFTFRNSAGVQPPLPKNQGTKKQTRRRRNIYRSIYNIYTPIYYYYVCRCVCVCLVVLFYFIVGCCCSVAVDSH